MADAPPYQGMRGCTSGHDLLGLLNKALLRRRIEYELLCAFLESTFRAAAHVVHVEHSSNTS